MDVLNDNRVFMLSHIIWRNLDMMQRDNCSKGTQRLMQHPTRCVQPCPILDEQKLVVAKSVDVNTLVQCWRAVNARGRHLRLNILIAKLMFRSCSGISLSCSFCIQWIQCLQSIDLFHSAWSIWSFFPSMVFHPNNVERHDPCSRFPWQFHHRDQCESKCSHQIEHFWTSQWKVMVPFWVHQPYRAGGQDGRKLTWHHNKVDRHCGAYQTSKHVVLQHKKPNHCHELLNRWF